MAVEEQICGVTYRSAGEPITAGTSCPYCKHWPADSPHGENGWVKCYRWRGQPSYGHEYGEPGQPELGRCEKCRRVWESDYDQVILMYPAKVV